MWSFKAVNGLTTTDLETLDIMTRTDMPWFRIANADLSHVRSSSHMTAILLHMQDGYS